MAKAALLHLVCAEPALAVVGDKLVNVTVAETDVQPNLLTVHLNTAEKEVNVTVLVLELEDAIEAEPLTTVHAPEPNNGGADAFIVNEALHKL